MGAGWADGMKSEIRADGTKPIWASDAVAEAGSRLAGSGSVGQPAWRVISNLLQCGYATNTCTELGGHFASTDEDIIPFS